MKQADTLSQNTGDTLTLTLPALTETCQTTFQPKDIFGESHVGLVRKDNQDSFAYKISDNGKNVFMIVADGIGGNERGDLASAYISEMMLREFEKIQDKEILTREKGVDFLKHTFTLAHTALRNLNSNLNIQHPMGTTAVVLLLTPEYAITGHAGDSRVYCLRDGELHQYTQDHSVINVLLKRGNLSKEQAKRHPMAHVIYQSMGVMYEIQPDFQVFDRKPGDRFLLCSDGLMLHLTDQSMRNILMAAKTPRNAVNHLITMALRGGGGDNTTVICAFPKD